MSPAPDIPALVRKVRRIHIRSRKAAAAFAAGQFRSTFKGAGIEFFEVRDYVPGDEVGAIDWNVTARTGRLHVKTFNEEREQRVLFVVDGSASLDFGSGACTKSETAAEACALLIFSALLNNDRAGLIRFTDRVDRQVPLGKGLNHGLRLVRELLSNRPPGRKTSLAAGLDCLNRVHRKRAVVFLVSDFLAADFPGSGAPEAAGFQRSLRLAAARHDLVAVRVWDRRERALDGGGVMLLEDRETGERKAVDLSHPGLRAEYAEAAQRRKAGLESLLAANSVDLLDFEAGKPTEGVIRSFFQRRLERRWLP